MDITRKASNIPGVDISLLDISYINNPLDPVQATALALAGPNRKDYVMNENIVPQYINYYDPNDTVQGWFGGTDFTNKFPYIDFNKTSNIATEQHATNIPINQNPISGFIVNSTKYLLPTWYSILKTGLGIKAHTNIQSNDTYNNFIKKNK